MRFQRFSIEPLKYIVLYVKRSLLCVSHNAAIETQNLSRLTIPSLQIDIFLPLNPLFRYEILFKSKQVFGISSIVGYTCFRNTHMINFSTLVWAGEVIVVGGGVNVGMYFKCVPVPSH